MSRKAANDKLQPAKPDPAFYLGEVIKYRNTGYEVIGLLSQRKLHMERLSDGQRFKLMPTDGLYKQLIKIKQQEDLKHEKEEKTTPALDVPAEPIKRTLKR